MRRPGKFVIVLLVVLFASALLLNHQRPAIERLEKASSRHGWNQCQGACFNNSTPSSSTTNIGEPLAIVSYFSFIKGDLSQWESKGITRAMLDKGVRVGASLRVSIVDGRLYLHNVYNVCPQSRPLFTVWGLLKLLEKFPGQVPDVELLINCKDRPIVDSSLNDPPPVFSYCKSDKTLDILLPDYSYWGWPEVRIDPWERQAQEIFDKSEETGWKERHPSAFWRGNSRMGKIRKALLECNSTSLGADIYEQNWGSSTAFQDSSKLSQQCKNRFNIYVEGAAWSASLKYRMACGSTMLYIDSDYYDFFSRALVPGVHYLPVPSSDKEKMCRTIWNSVRWGNSNIEMGEDIGRNSREFVEKELSMEHIYNYMLRLLSAYANLQRFQPRVPANLEPICSQTIRCIASDGANAILAKS